MVIKMKQYSFIKVTMGLFLKLAVTDFICLLACLFLFPLSNNSIMRVLIQILCLIASIAIVYSHLYALGDRDRNMVENGHFKNIPAKGLFIGLTANLPFMVTGVLLVLSKMGYFSEKFIGVYRILNGFYFSFNTSILPANLSISEMGWGAIWLSIATFLIIPLIAMFAYMIGFERFRLSEKLLYKQSKSE